MVGRFGGRRQRGRRGGLVAVLTVGGVLAASGCSSSDGTAEPVPSVSRAPYAIGSPVPYAGPAAAPNCDVEQSLSPTPLPTPGRMPEGSTMARIQAAGFLTVGVDQATPFFAAMDPDTGQLGGFDIEMAREVAAAIFGDRSKVRFRVVTPAQRMEVLKTAKVDMVVDTMSITCERRKDADFTSPYYTDNQVLLVPKNSTATTLEELAGKKVCASLGTTVIRRISEAAVEPKPIAYGVNDRADCLIAMQLGEADAATTYQGLLAGLAAQDPQTKVVGKPITTEVQGIGVPKGREDFVRFLNAHLERIKADGTWLKLYRATIEGKVPPQGPPKGKYAG